MRTAVNNERGSVLIVAVIAMLIMGVLSVSFALLSNIETTIGFNFKQQAQAEALAEAGLDVGRDIIRSAGGLGSTGFTDWFNGTSASHILVNGTSLGAGQYWVRIDNDCAAYNTVTAAIQESSTCNNTTDTNEKAVLTAWAVAGAGRSRVRAVMGVDSPWKHVCADARPDNGGYCNDTRNTKGNPSVKPADPNSENGPRAYDDLPRPIIGCSRIDPSVHGETVASCAAIAAGATLFAQPAMAANGTTTLAPGYPAYPAAPSSFGPKLVIMGEDPAITPTAKNCDAGGQQYFGYFDCALSTPCPLAVCGAVRKACVKNGDLRLADTANYYDASTPGGCGAANTGMVFTGSPPDFIGSIGSAGSPVVVYVMHDPGGNMATDGSGAAVASTGSGGNALQMVGTLVVEGSVSDKNKTEICTGGPVPSPAPTNPCFTTPTVTGYGYPVAVLAYDPKLPYPTIAPYAPQGGTNQPTLRVGIDFGTPNTIVNGIVYSGGRVEFNPINVNGSTVGFDIDVQGTSSTYQYIPTYGNASPPPGFPAGSSNPVVLMLKSFIACTNFSDESSGPTSCN